MFRTFERRFHSSVSMFWIISSWVSELGSAAAWSILKGPRRLVIVKTSRLWERRPLKGSFQMAKGYYTYTADAAAEAFLICCHCLRGDDVIWPFFPGKELSLRTGDEAHLSTFRLCDGSNRAGADLARPEKARIWDGRTIECGLIAPYLKDPWITILRINLFNWLWSTTFCFEICALKRKKFGDRNASRDVDPGVSQWYSSYLRRQNFKPPERLQDGKVQ